MNSENNITPDPSKVFPAPSTKGITLIKPTITRPDIEVGDFSYFADTDFEKHVTHHYDWIGDKLIIGKFCQIGKGVEFVMNGANHRMNTATTFPFYIMEGWEQQAPELSQLPLKGDTVVGNDVWIGEGVTILPGVHIGDGAIIGKNSTVADDIPPYSIAVGNPAFVTKERFDKDMIDLLEELKWWDRDITEIKALLPLLSSPDIDDVRCRLKILLGKPLEFKATILQNEGMDAAYVEVPFDILGLFGKGRLPVCATFDSVPYEGQMVRMGSPRHILGIPKAIRTRIGKDFGDTVTVTFTQRGEQKATASTLVLKPQPGRKKEGRAEGDLKVKFYPRVEDDSVLKFAVIIARTTKGKWVLCRHEDRTTLEFPGGHREEGESILDTAKRELREETGARAYTIQPLCAYSVTGKNSVNEGGEETFGMLYRAVISSFGKTHSEIEEVLQLDELPDNWTYPQIQPLLLEKYREITQQ